MRIKKIIAFILFSLFGLAIAAVALTQNPQKKEAGYGYIDFTGKVIIPMIYRDASTFYEGLAVVSLNGKEYGYIDKTGKIVIPLKFYRTYGFTEGLAQIAASDDYDAPRGFIDKKGKIVIPPQFARVNPFYEGLAPVLPRNYSEFLWGFIDRSGKMVLPPIYINDLDTIRFSDGLAAVKDTGYSTNDVGYIDRKGKVVIPFQFVYAHYFVNGFAKVEESVPGKSIQEETKEYCINKSGTKVSMKYCYRKNIKIYDPEGKLPFSVFESEHNEHIEVTGQPKPTEDKKTGLYGYKDENGKLIIPYQFESADTFSEGLAQVSK